MEVGSRLGHYVIEAMLGSGGMGVVYAAEDTKLGRRVALKVLPQSIALDPERRQRFEREARAVAALNHPNIVTVHSVEEDSGVIFLTMELVEGKMLSELIAPGGLTVDRILRIAIPLADAIAAAHERGIMHRDLKPANIMMASGGRVKVLDFGLAKLRDERLPGEGVTTLPAKELTGEGRILGTVAYMSPEQAEGKPIDHRSDVFSLGVVLYELATGERPFKGDTSVSVISSIIKDTPPSVVDIKPALPRDLSRIIKRALVKDPEHRYQTAKDLRNDLETLKEELDSGGAHAPVPPPQRAEVARAKNAKLAAATVAIGALVMVGLWYARRQDTASKPAEPFQNVTLSRLTSTGRATAAALSPDGRYVVHVVDQDERQSLWVRQAATTSNVQIVAPDMVRYDGVTFAPDGNYIYYVVYPYQQNFSVVYQIPVLGGTPRKILDDVDTPVSFSPDGKRFAFLRGYQSRGEIALMVANADGSGERSVSSRKIPLTYPTTAVAWSPDGATIAVHAVIDATRRAGLFAVDVQTGRETRIGETLWDEILGVSWLSDGSGLIVTGRDLSVTPSSQVSHVSYPAGTARRVTNDLNHYAQMSLSADSRTLVTVQGDQNANVWVMPAADSDAARQASTGHFDGSFGVSWTPDGRVVYVSDASGNLDIWAANADGTNAHQLTVDPKSDRFPTVTPDGRYIVFHSDRGEAGHLWRMDVDGTNQRQLAADPGAFWPLISPDSQWVYYTSYAKPQRTIWKVPIDGGTAVHLTASWPGEASQGEGLFFDPTITPRAISPDGTRFAASYADAARRGFRVGVFPINGGTPIRFDISSATVAWTRDGSGLVHLDPRDPSNLYVQPVAGGKSRPLTAFKTDLIFNFAISADGRQYAISRGTVTNDVVVIRDVAAGR
jgi:serine/threonine protein kinase/Tol biopolymer transport system component